MWSLPVALSRTSGRPGIGHACQPRNLHEPPPSQPRPSHEAAATSAALAAGYVHRPVGGSEACMRAHDQHMEAAIHAPHSTAACDLASCPSESVREA